MKKISLIRSIRDLAALKAETLCGKDKPYYKSFVDGMEKKIVDDLIDDAITQENHDRVTPILRAFVKSGDISPIPVPFEMDGTIYTQIKRDSYSFEVSSDGEHWHYLSRKNEIHLYETLDAAGCLDSLE